MSDREDRLARQVSEREQRISQLESKLREVEKERDEFKTQCRNDVDQIQSLEEELIQLTQLKQDRDALKESLHYANGTAELAMKHCDEAEKDRDAMVEALKDIYQWYDRDGSVGGASEVFENHRPLSQRILNENEQEKGK